MEQYDEMFTRLSRIDEDIANSKRRNTKEVRANDPSGPGPHLELVQQIPGKPDEALVKQKVAVELERQEIRKALQEIEGKE